MSSDGQPLITTQHIHYASTAQDQQGSLSNSMLTETPHFVTQVRPYKIMTKMSSLWINIIKYYSKTINTGTNSVLIII